MASLDERLFLACTRGDLNEVADCLNKGANMNRVCSSGRTPLGLSAQIGNIAILKLLLKVGALQREILPGPSTSDKSNLGYFVVVHNEANSPSDVFDEQLHDCPFFSGIDFDDFYSPLMERLPWMQDSSISLNDTLTPDGMHELEWEEEIQDDVNFSSLDTDPYGALYIWYANILSQTGSLLEEKPPPDDINGADQFGCTALHYAAIEGHNDAIRLLISEGCKVNAEDSDNFTPLHMAAAKSRVDIVELLLKYGANPQHRSTDGITPLHVSASRGLLANVSALVAAGANVNAVDISDRTPLYLAVSRRQHSVVDLLIEKGAKVNFEEIHGYTPLFEAVSHKDVALVETLLAAGAKVTQSHYLLHYAILHRHEAMARLLIQAGSIINLRDDNGDTPLMLAVRTQSGSITRLLLQHGSSVHCVNSVTRQTALQNAISFITRNCEQFKEMFSILEEFGWDHSNEPNALSFAVSADNIHAASTLIRQWDIVSDENLKERNELMNFLLLRGNRYLVELIIMAGFKLNSFQTCSAVMPLPQWFTFYQKHPLSLRDLCRIRIRKSLKRNIANKLNDLRLPGLLKCYLRLEDLPCPCQSGVT